MKETGYVFPKVIPNSGGTYCNGLGNRDYIAIHALQGIVANPEYAEASYEQAATMAYGYADALIKQSEVKDEHRKKLSQGTNYAIQARGDANE